MKKFKIVLQSNNFYYALIIFLICFILITTKLITYKSKISNEVTSLTGTVLNYEKDENKYKITLKEKEKVIVNYYDTDIDIHIGDLITVNGSIYYPNNNTIFNTFNYKKYLYNNKIYCLFKADSILIKERSKNIFIKLKNLINQKCSKDPYLKLFILGDKSLLEDEAYNSYKKIGIAHMLAISGMHISILTLILNKLFFFFREYSKKRLIILILIFYSYLVNFSISVLRCTFVYILDYINSKYELNLNKYKILLLSIAINVIINPFCIYYISFLYSYICSFAIIISKRFLNSNNYFKGLIKTSFYISLFTFPITINLNYEINLLLFLSNLIFIPFITFVYYPMILIYFFIPLLKPIVNFFTILFEKSCLLLSSIEIFNIVIPKLNLMFIVFYYLFLLIFILFNKKIFLVSLFILILIYKNKILLNSDLLIDYLDVNQGDSIMIKMPNKNDIVLIDTGGSYGNNYISNNIILYLKSLGVSKISQMIISHGDFDHMGEAINLVENFKVENVIFNCGEYNDLEKNLIKVLDKKKINYYSCIKELNIDKYKLQLLNTKKYDNENENSNVIYFNYNDYKFLFMGDAGIEREKDILDKYNLKDIDFLKVGHHGSNTSSGEYFINEINPKYSLISVGKNNRYGHPKTSVLDTLSNSTIYRTDLDGSIEIQLNKNGHKIITCPP